MVKPVRPRVGFIVGLEEGEGSGMGWIGYSCCCEFIGQRAACVPVTRAHQNFFIFVCNILYVNA
jgi:hypothetical protein